MTCFVIHLAFLSHQIYECDRYSVELAMEARCSAFPDFIFSIYISACIYGAMAMSVRLLKEVMQRRCACFVCSGCIYECLAMSVCPLGSFMQRRLLLIIFIFNLAPAFMSAITTSKCPSRKQMERRLPHLFCIYISAIFIVRSKYPYVRSGKQNATAYSLIRFYFLSA